jgi:uncharacterized membrane protein YdjX (TVP38/TMEM64 family)
VNLILSRRIKILLVALFALLVLILSKRMFDVALPSRESIQAFYMAYGIWGYLFYLCFGIIAVFIVPINFSLIGMAGGFVYGPWIAFFTNWAAKIIGNLIGFYLGRHFGPRVLRYFSKAQQEKFTRILHSEMSLRIYMTLSFLPFTPSDAMSYFLGATPIKLRTFIPVMALGSSGTAFALAYVGSGEAIKNPLILAGMALVLVAGLTWVHYRSKAIAS